MSKQTFNPRPIVLLGMIVLAAAMRIPNAGQMTPWANFSPIGAIALFGGAYFTRWKAFLFPLIALVLSDLAISTFIFHGKLGILYGEWYWMYGIFVVMILLGKWIIGKVTAMRVILASFSVVIMHWLLSDMKIWIGGGVDIRTLQPLSRGIDGLLQSYVQGFPFMRNFLVGTLAYSGLMFGIFEWIKKYNPRLQVKTNQSVHV